MLPKPFESPKGALERTKGCKSVSSSVLSYLAHYETRVDLEQLVAEYVYFYNFERINLKNGLTPFEIRSKAA